MVDIIGAIGGAYSLINQFWFSRPKMACTVIRSEIINITDPNALTNISPRNYSKIEILCTIANIGGGILGIGKIVVKSRTPNYDINVKSWEYSNGQRGEHKISFSLSHNNPKEILLIEDHAPHLKDKKGVKAEIKIYNLKSKLIETIPIELVQKNMQTMRI